ncbi:MAG: ATP-binding protein [Saprospiraceae bacterium]|nr:ATP-binding protein [Saprospiraceae bacterium]
MLTEERLREILKDNLKLNPLKEIIQREIEIPLNSDRIVVVSGIRRCGKSTLLKYTLNKYDSVFFLNFEDIRLNGFDASDFQKLEQIAIIENIKFLVFDEIQNIPNWEKFVRSSHDKGFQIFITGSNASLLSRELGTRLTGRHLQLELFPFSYKEYLTLKSQTANVESFTCYLKQGGFPEFLISEDEDYLRSLARDVVIRDIAVRRNIKNDHILLRLISNLFSNIGKEISFNNITKIIGIKSVRTTIDYCDYLKESYLIDLLPRFSFSIKQQQNNPKKVYAIDTAMGKSISLSFSEDSGRMLENTVFLMLKNVYSDILYYKDESSECDFLVRKANKIVLAVQVCWHLTSENLERELKGLKNAMRTCSVKNGFIITMEQDEKFGDIKAIPAWKFDIKSLNIP